MRKSNPLRLESTRRVVPGEYEGSRVTNGAGAVVAEYDTYLHAAGPDRSATTVAAADGAVGQPHTVVVTTRDAFGCLGEDADDVFLVRPTSAPTPKTSTPMPIASTPMPITSTPTPITSAPTPKTSTPMPIASTPMPITSTPMHITSTPMPTTSTPMPITSDYLTDYLTD
eukprot:1194381-Prorocentrum_minimum.AAC.4